MALYENQRKESPITAVEFSPVSDGNFAFFHIDSPVKRNAFKQWLESIGQEVMAETSINGRPVFVTHGDKSQEAMMKLLEEQGDKLTLKRNEKGFDFWKLRGGISVVGQSLQMLSSATRMTQDKATGNWEHKGIDGSIMAFAVLNMAANIMNFAFGSQKSPDDNHLAYLKEQFNGKLDSHVADGSELPDSNDKRVTLHLEPPAPKTIGQKTYDFLQKNSVTFGEIGLRFAAAVALVFPMNNGKSMIGGWKGIAEGLMKGEGMEAIRNGLQKNPTQRMAGILYLVGKTVALFTKVKDPYDPKPHTAMDTFREEVVFKAGSLIEMLAGGMVAYNAYANNKIGFGEKPQPVMDYPGMIGGGLFASGYFLRLFAKFGEKQMNMEELHAHISDSLAKVPPNELPQLMADCAATLKEHFKDKPLEFGKLYTQMMVDMYRYHHIALDNLGTEPSERVAKMQEHKEDIAQDGHPVLAMTGMAGAASEGDKENKHTDKHHPRKSIADIAAVTPSASHAEKAAQVASEPHLGLSA